MFDQPSKRKRLTPEIIQSFQPNPGEMLFVAGLRCIQMLCFLGSLVATIDYFSDSLYPGWTDHTWLPYAIVASFLTSFYRGMLLEKNLRPNHLLVVAAEMLVLLILVRVIALFFGFDRPFLTLGFIFDCLFICFAWQFGRSWQRNFYFMYVQPWELTEKEGGAPGIQEIHRIPHEHGPVYAGLKSSLYWYGGAQVLFTLTCVSVANQYGHTAGKTEFTGSLVIFVTIHLLLTLPLFLWARWRYLRTMWKVERLHEPAGLGRRWTLYLLALTLVAVLPALLLSNLTFALSLPFNNANFQDIPILSWYATRNRQQTQPDQTPPPDIQPRQMFQLPGWVSFLMLVFGATTIVFLAYLILEKAGFPLPDLRSVRLKGLLKGLGAWFRGLFRKGPPVEFVRDEREAGRFNLFGRFRREKVPEDPRGQIRYHYRHMARRAANAHLPRRLGQTPEEYELFLADQIEQEELKPDLNGITNLYEEAAFSPHPVDESEAHQARTSSERLAAYFRRIRRAK